MRALSLAGRYAARMDDSQLLRYSRHILLDDVGIEGQRRLLAAHALVIGAGGLGSPVALYLGTAGVGTITLVDDDVVELTNLQRQIAHDLSCLGQPKAESAARSIQAIFSCRRITPTNKSNVPSSSNSSVHFRASSRK